MMQSKKMFIIMVMVACGAAYMYHKVTAMEEHGMMMSGSMSMQEMHTKMMMMQEEINEIKMHMMKMQEHMNMMLQKMNMPTMPMMMNENKPMHW
jgi:hypothetical protein